MRRLVGLFAIITSLSLIMAPMAAQAAEYADVLNNVVDKVSSGLAALTEAMSNAAPRAWELVVLGNWTDAAVGIALSGIFALFAVITGIVGTRVLRYGLAQGEYEGEGYKIGGTFGLIASGILTLIAVICFGVNLAMFLQPEAMTARDFLFDAIGRKH